MGLRLSKKILLNESSYLLRKFGAEPVLFVDLAAHQTENGRVFAASNIAGVFVNEAQIMHLSTLGRAFIASTTKACMCLQVMFLAWPHPALSLQCSNDHLIPPQMITSYPLK